MRARYTLTPTALRDLLGIWTFIGEEDLRAADRLVEQVHEKLRLLAENPGTGRSRDELARGLRSFPCGPYIIFYRIIENGVEVMRVIHGARDLPRLF